MDCLFCKIINKEIPANIVYEDENVLAFLDIKPVNPGHTLVLPKMHSENTDVASEDVVATLAQAVQKIAPGVCKATNATAWNLMVNTGSDAGQLVMHTHWHIVPRHVGDGYQHWHGAPYAEGEATKLAEAIKNSL